MTSNTAVRARRAAKKKLKDGQRVIPDSLKYLPDAARWLDLNFYPTPPWATRALFTDVFPEIDEYIPASAWEPACGLGHMAAVLRERVAKVMASDVADYGSPHQDGVIDFRTSPPLLPAPEWVITNPPFDYAQEFLEKAMTVATRGVALLVRLAFLEGEERYETLWTRFPPTLHAPFAERVAMCLGGWDPVMSTASAYAWFVWKRNSSGQWSTPLPNARSFPTFIIPPGRRAALSRPSDAVLASLHVPGWVAPTTLKRTGQDQLSLLDA